LGARYRLLDDNKGIQIMRRKTSNKGVIDVRVVHAASPGLSGVGLVYALSPEEEELCMRRIAENDREAFNTVVEAYMADIFRFSYSILKDQAAAEDIVQETFYRLWTKAAQWNPSGRLKSWLMRIAHNLCIDEIRGKKDIYPEDVQELAFPDQAPDQLERYATQQSGDIVRTALLDLPERQRTALSLVYYQGHSNIEAADIMNVSVDALESLLARGRQGMKQTLERAKSYLLEG
jgi:RNA polymerase sigma-70 factor, ECF subfamily